MAEFDIFGIEFNLGGKSKRGREGKRTMEYNIDKEELLNSLDIRGKPTFIQYNLKTKQLYIKVEEE